MTSLGQPYSHSLRLFSFNRSCDLKPNFRPARVSDLEVLIALLADDPLGANREDTSQPINPRYLESFNQISRDPNNQLIAMELNGKTVGMLQLTFIPYLTHTGSWRCLVEGVRIHRDYRGRGLGQSMLEWAIERAKEKHCTIVQLTSDKTRRDAIRFYQSLGFAATHEGFKLSLSE